MFISFKLSDLDSDLIMPSIFLNSDGLVVDNHVNGSEYKLFQDSRAEFTDELPVELLKLLGLM